MKLTSSCSTSNTSLPQTSKPARLEFPDSSCGDKHDHKILVAYASEFGTTRDVAKLIGETLCQDGASVDIKWVNNVENLNDYDAVIIGSAIQYDKWMPEARKFVTTHQNCLSKLPVAYFFTCLTLSRQNEKTERQALKYAENLYALCPSVKPVSVGRFAGALIYSKMSFLQGLLFRVLYLFLGVQEGDYRNWDAIRSWAKAMHSELLVERKL